MSVEKIASDLAKKSYISRNLGGVVKAGEYAAWAEEYKDIAQEHYDSLKAEKKAAIDPLVLNTLIGGGLGAGAGALGSLASELVSGKKNKNRWRDALTYGLIGGAGGAGLGAAKQLWSDRNAIDKATTWAQGLPPKEYPSEELAALSKQINDKGIHNSTLTGGATNAAIQGTTGAAGGAVVGTGVDKLIEKIKPNSFRPSGVDTKEVIDTLKKIKPSRVETSSHNKPIGDVNPGRSYVQEATNAPRHEQASKEFDDLYKTRKTKKIINTELSGKSPAGTFRENKTPWVSEATRIPAVNPGDVFGFDKNTPLDLTKVDPKGLLHRMTGGDPRKMEAMIRHITGPEGKSFLENLAKVENPAPTMLSRLLGYNQKARLPKITMPEVMKPGVGKGTRAGGILGGLLGVGSATADAFNASKSRTEIGGILADNIKKTLSSPEVANNPEYVKILSALADEASKGVSAHRGNQIVNTLNNMFVQ